jgi:hypothetical protein
MVSSLRSDFNSDLRATPAYTLRTRMAAVLNGVRSRLDKDDLSGFSVASAGNRDLAYRESAPLTLPKNRTKEERARGQRGPPEKV